jgi:hypothetical protein
VKSTITHDECDESPRTDRDSLGRMACWHGRHNLGDEQPKESPRDFLAHLKREKSEFLPLYLFDHSGLTLSTDSEVFRSLDSMGWDWGLIGWIYVLPEKGRKEFGRQWRRRAMECMLAEVREYDQYLRGDVWQYIVEDDDGNVIDSCGGFYGYGHAKEEAETALRICLEMLHAGTQI